MPDYNGQLNTNISSVFFLEELSYGQDWFKTMPSEQRVCVFCCFVRDTFPALLCQIHPGYHKADSHWHSTAEHKQEPMLMHCIQDIERLAKQQRYRGYLYLWCLCIKCIHISTFTTGRHGSEMFNHTFSSCRYGFCPSPGDLVTYAAAAERASLWHLYTLFSEWEITRTC